MFLKNKPWGLHCRVQFYVNPNMGRHEWRIWSDCNSTKISNTVRFQFSHSWCLCRHNCCSGFTDYSKLAHCPISQSWITTDSRALAVSKHDNQLWCTTCPMYSKGSLKPIASHNLLLCFVHYNLNACDPPVTGTISCHRDKTIDNRRQGSASAQHKLHFLNIWHFSSSFSSFAQVPDKLLRSAN